MTVVLRKVLLELSDSELEIGLGLDHPMHRKKVRLAIEERRLGFHVRYPLLSTIGNTWVTKEWLVDVGLAQVSSPFLLLLQTLPLTHIRSINNR